MKKCNLRERMRIYVHARVYIAVSGEIRPFMIYTNAGRVMRMQMEVTRTQMGIWERQTDAYERRWEVMRTLKGRIQEPDSTRTQLRGDFRREKSLGGSKMRSNMRKNDRYHLQFTLKVERKNRKKKMKWPEIRIVVFVWLRGCVDNQIHYLSAFIVFFVRTLAQTTCNHTIFEKHRWINRETQRRQSNPLSWQSFVLRFSFVS